MKGIIVVLCLMNFLSLNSNAQYSNETESKNYILALSVELYLNTSSNVPCDLFAEIFNKSLKIKGIFQVDSLQMFFNFVSKVKYTKQSREIDVRGKFIYEFDDISTIVCTDGRNILLNGKLIKKNKKFLKLLYSIVGWHSKSPKSTS